MTKLAPLITIDLRPITLLKVIRKTLSKITLNRMKPKFEEYLSTSQCAYRNNRSTTDAIWSYRWILSKVQEEDITIYVTGIDMSAAFDTIKREDIMSIVEEIGEEDDIRMVRALLSETTLEVKLKGYEGEPTIFISNRGASQGDGLSGPFFTVDFEYALREVRAEFAQTPTPAGHEYIMQNINNPIVTPDHDHAYNTEEPSQEPPSEITFADDHDELTTDINYQNMFIAKVAEILKRFGLEVNNSKTEKTTLKRGDRDTETWRKVVKLGNCLGDMEDITNRKQLSKAAYIKITKVWLENHTDTLDQKVQLSDSLVTSVFLPRIEESRRRIHRKFSQEPP